MTHSPRRRSLLLAGLALPLAGLCAPIRQNDATSRAIRQQLAELERASGGRLGVCAIHRADGSRILYRANERFAFCSTFKAMVVVTVLKQSMRDSNLLQRRLTWSKAELDQLGWSPITAKHLADGLTVAELCAATMQYSDNCAVTALMKMLGGPAAINRFARSIGDKTFRLDRWELALNSAIPGDPRDTTTPAAMAATLQRLVFDDVLAAPQRAMYIDWLKGNTTGSATIRAGVPKDWVVGDKTGSGGYGTTNDIGVIWPPSAAPIVLAVYFTQKQPKAEARRDVIAAATRIVVQGKPA